MYCRSVKYIDFSIHVKDKSRYIEFQPISYNLYLSSSNYRKISNKFNDNCTFLILPGLGAGIPLSPHCFNLVFVPQYFIKQIRYVINTHIVYTSKYENNSNISISKFVRQNDLVVLLQARQRSVPTYYSCY